jgi:hypothetical protein
MESGNLKKVGRWLKVLLKPKIDSYEFKTHKKVIW